MDGIKETMRKVMEARNRPGGMDIDPDSPEALIHGEGSISMTPEEMEELFAQLKKEGGNVATPTVVISLVLYLILAVIIFGFIGELFLTIRVQWTLRRLSIQLESCFLS
jgi:hypothetical protein